MFCLYMLVNIFNYTVKYKIKATIMTSLVAGALFSAAISFIIAASNLGTKDDCPRVLYCLTVWSSSKGPSNLNSRVFLYLQM